MVKPDGLSDAQLEKRSKDLKKDIGIIKGRISSLKARRDKLTYKVASIAETLEKRRIITRKEELKKQEEEYNALHPESLWEWEHTKCHAKCGRLATECCNDCGESYCAVCCIPGYGGIMLCPREMCTRGCGPCHSCGQRIPGEFCNDAGGRDYCNGCSD